MKHSVRGRQNVVVAFHCVRQHARVFPLGGSTPRRSDDVAELCKVHDAVAAAGERERENA